MKVRIIAGCVSLILLLGVWADLRPDPEQSKKSARRTSPPYTVMVAIEMSSPYVPDGRMTFADLAFSATFRDVVVFNDPARGAGIIEDQGGRLFLTRHAFNDVYDGAERHKPWVEKAWPNEFAASLLSGWSEKDEDEVTLDMEGMPIAPLVKETVKIGFLARFGLLDLEWISKLGSNVLSNMLFEFQAPLNPLLEGKPLTLKFPYEGGDPEDHGEWWIEFIPKK
ncbi:MAG: hypothetical protein SCM96_11975 [Acidobacteriota bacterium]|nr:hypothetical protein [Acidobacteriota bacterium]